MHAPDRERGACSVHLCLLSTEVYVSKNNAVDPQEDCYLIRVQREEREREGHEEMKNKGAIHFL
jgi:hypothetical protein